MLEIEMKFPVADFGPIREQLQLRQASPFADRGEIDHYFNAPDRDFAQTDEALRIRSIGDRNMVTYKGPKTDPHTKTRTEIEADLANGVKAADNFREILQKLGYRYAGAVEKRRTIYQINNGGFCVQVCLDEVRNLGLFVELEIQAPERQLEAARHVLQGLAEELNLTHGERRSYLELQLAGQHERRK